MASRKHIRVGTVTEVIVPSVDLSDRFAATLYCAIRDDEGRNYVIHVTAEQIAELTKYAGAGRDA